VRCSCKIFIERARHFDCTDLTRRILYTATVKQTVSSLAVWDLSSPRGEVDPGRSFYFMRWPQKLSVHFWSGFPSSLRPSQDRYSSPHHQLIPVLHQNHQVQHYTTPFTQAIMPGSVASSSDDEVSFQQAHHCRDTLLNLLFRTRASLWTLTSFNRMVISSKCSPMRFAYPFTRHQPVRHPEAEECRLLHCCGRYPASASQ